jgi:hypothetical protein
MAKISPRPNALLRRSLHGFISLLAASLAACEAGPPPVGSIATSMPAELEDVVGAAVSVQVEVLDRSGRPIDRYPVNFATKDGSVVPVEGLTEASGKATTRWTLGTAAGTQSLTARAGEQSVTISAQAKAAAPARLVVVSGSGQTAPVGQLLTTPIVVRVDDRHGNPVSNVEVAFRVLSPTGTLGAISTRTGASGMVSPVWTLGSAIGEQALSAEVMGLEPVRLTVTAGSGPAARVTAVSGAGQTGQVGRALASPLIVELRDRFGNLAANGTVDFRGDGAVMSARPTAGPDGRASTMWILGTRAGAQTMRAVVGERADSTSFAVTATAAAASAVELVSGNAQRGWAGGFLSDSLVVRIEDEFDNPVPGATVSFIVSAGGGQADPPNATTGTDGRAQAAWRLGPALGTNTLQARVGAGNAASFSATATSGPPHTLAVVSGAGQKGPILTPLPEPIVILVTDEALRPVQGARVQAQTEGVDRILPPSPITDSLGRASFLWSVGVAAGAQHLRLRSIDAPDLLLPATVTPGPPHQPVKIGDNQRGRAGEQVPISLGLIVKDAFANPIPGVSVKTRMDAGGGIVLSAGCRGLITNANGFVCFGTWKLGLVPGVNRFVATVEGWGDVEFTAIGDP